MSRGWRLIAAALLASGGLLVAAPARGAIDGVLHETSCVDDGTLDAGSPCAHVSGMDGIGQIAAYGSQVYVPARISNSLLVFDRNADGSLTQKPGGAGCFNTSGASGCTNAGPGMTNAIAAAVSPDGSQLYVVGQSENSIVVFARNTSDGTLTPEHCYTATVVTGCSETSGATFPTLVGPVAVGVSPDSKSVYVASLGAPGSLSAFNTAPGSALTPTTGNGTYSRCIWGGSGVAPPNCISDSLLNDSRDVLVSPDGNNVYLADVGNNFTGNVLAFDRDTNSTNSTFGSVKLHAPTAAGCLGQGTGCGALAGLESPNQLAVSSDGSRLFATERTTSNIIAIDRAANGDMAPHSPNSCVGACSGGIGYAGPFDVVITPDGQHVYAGALSNQGITLNSNAAGASAFAQAPLPFGCIVAGTQGGACLDLPNGGAIESLAVSPDGRFLYASVDNPDGTRVLTLRIDRAPVCAPVVASTGYATAVTIQLSCSDADGDPLTFQKVSDPAHGILGALQPGGQITYSPFGGTSGADSFTYDAVGAGVTADPQTVTITVGAPPPPPPPPPVQTRRIHLTTLGTWSVSNRGVRIGKMVLHGLTKGDTVKLTCSSCHVKQTLTAKGSTLSLTKLRHKVLKRRKGFSVVATAAGAIGDQLTVTVKNYGHKHADFVRESDAPFKATHRCLPVGSTKPQKTC